MNKLLGIFLALAGVFTAAAAILYRIFLKTDIKKFPSKSQREDEKWLHTVDRKDVYITSRDGLFLHGSYVTNSSDNWVILVHGYDAESGNMGCYAEKFYNRGYSVFMPDLRGNGLSEGNEITMGHLERLDLCDWINKLIAEMGAEKILLFGVSMGASTVMLTSAEKLPSAVRAVIEDCGYTSVKDEFAYNMKQLLHLPPYPLLWIVDIITRLRKGWSVMKDADCIKAVGKRRLPILLIHGSADTFVPFEMHDRLFEAAAEPKEKLVIYGAGHVESSSTEPERYWGRVLEFADKYMK